MFVSDTLFKSIQAASSGLTLSDLLALHPKIARRTAQRHLALLVENGAVTFEGAARARRYFVGAQQGSPQPSKALFDTPNREALSKEGVFDVINLSADSLDILTYVNQPVMARKPIGYQPDFLNSYVPNHTFYLSASLRRRLHKMGATDHTSQPAGTYSRAVLNRLLVDLSWASSHLEGNKYSRLDTINLIEHGTQATGKASIDTQMILNHKTAIELLVENIHNATFNRFTLMNVHSALAENLLPNPSDEGRIRQHTVDIGLSVYRPLGGASHIDQYLTLLLDKANQISDAFEQAFFIMVHVPYLQPFADINKRTSRLMANLPLFKANLCPLTFLGVPEQAYSRAILGVYEMTRTELLRDVFVWAYERSTQEYLAIKQHLSEPDPLRLKWRDFIKRTIHDVVVNKQENALSVIQHNVAQHIPPSDKEAVEALVIEELQRLHEGVLARYGLRPSQFEDWKGV